MNQQTCQRAIKISLAISVIMLIGKGIAYHLTYSYAMLADFLESLIHGVVTAFTAFSIWYAKQPPDEQFNYGRGRIIYFAVGFEGALILSAAFAILWTSIKGLLGEPAFTHLGAGIIIATVLAVINLLLGQYLMAIGKRYDSIALVANGKHVLSDFGTTFAAIAGMTIVMATGLNFLDPAIALLIALMIGFSGIQLLWKSFNGLIDRIDEPTLLNILDRLKEMRDLGHLSDFHNVRCRRVDNTMYVECHLLMQNDMPLLNAHDNATLVEERIRDLFPNNRIHITTHVEPIDHNHGARKEYHAPNKWYNRI